MASLSALLAFSLDAADKNGVSPNTISLPKGPGSIEGLGESFQPTINTGTAKYSLGIKLPPGTAGHHPELSLSYEGGGGNGPLGYGWALTLPHVQRRTDQGIPTYGQDLGLGRPDTFINEAREALVPRADGFFFCENERAFVRYRQVADHWEAMTPGGTKLEFGLTAAGRIEDPTTPGTFCWLLQRETDTHGNVIEYGYRTFPGDENLNQKYLASIRYGPGAPPWTHCHLVAFEYERRPDWFEDGRAGFLVRTGRRLKSIIVGTQGPPLPGHLAGDFDADGTLDHLNRRYDLAYLEYAGADSHWSLLERVTLLGADGVTALPPARFAYAVSDPPAQISALSGVWGGVNEPSAVMDNPLVDLIDLNADGLPDVLKTESGGGAHTVAVNRGPVRQDERWAMRWEDPVVVDPGAGAAWNFDLSSERTHLADMDGDGLADLVHKNADDAVFYFANRGRLSWAGRQDMSLEGTPPPAPFGQAGVRTADVDFDKRIDIVQSVDVGGTIAHRVWFNLGSQAYSSPRTVETEGGFDLAMPGVELVDCNGDRVPDSARIQPGAVQVAAGLGYGRFAAPRAMVLSDITLDEAQLARAKLTDLNGDGLADLVLERAEPGTCWYWLNLGNYAFTARHTIVDLPAAPSQHTAVRWADLNGNGTIDLIYADSQATPRLQLVELGQLVSGGLAPNLLTRIENGIGRLTRIDYAPSTQFALEDAAAGRPWPDAVPFPVIVVAAVTVADSLGHEYVTRFRYHDGYYDWVEKQFRGFAEVELMDLGDVSAPTLVSRSRFDTGRRYDAMKGRLLRAALETEDGRVFEEEITTWADPPRMLLEGTNGQAVRFAHPVASVKQIRELDQGLPRRLEAEFAYDDYGNQTRWADYGIVEGGDRSAHDDERVTVTEYALNLEAWIVRLPKRELVQDEHGTVVSRSELFYDDETFSGDNLGTVTVGNLTLRRDWIDPASASAYVSSARTKFDPYGNAVWHLDPVAVAPRGAVDLAHGHARALTYDPAFRAFPVAETIHQGGGRPALVFQAAFDMGFASVTAAIDFNTNTTRFGYDALGRLTRVIRPLDTEAFPTSEYDYVLQAPAPYWESGRARTGAVNYVETRRLDRAPGTAGARRDHYLISRQFVDGLGRTLMTRSEAEPAPGHTGSRVVVDGAMLFNARQKPARTLNPFFTQQPGSLDEQLAFENIEAPGWQGQFHRNGAMASLDLAAAHQSRTDYDATLRVTQRVNPDGSLQRTVHEPLLTRVFDENDASPVSPHVDTPTVRFADGLGRLIRVDEVVRLKADGTASDDLHAWSTRYAYDLNDRLTRITDSQNNVKTIRYDGLKRRVSMDDPDSGRSTHVYDAASNLIEKTDAKGQRTTFAYDGANRLTTVDYHDAGSGEFSYGRSPDIRFHYDEPPGRVDQGDGTRASGRNALGALAWVDDTSGQEHLSYDARGRKEWIVKRVPDPVISGTALGGMPLVAYRTAFDYDSMDRVTRMIYPDHDQVTYHYNDRNLLERIGGGPGAGIISAIEYRPSGQPARVDHGNRVQSTYDYDERLRLSRLVTAGTARAAELIHYRYEFDGVSNLRAIHDERSTEAVAATDQRRNSQAFSYDDLYRLTKVRYNLNLPAATPDNRGEIRYRHDRIGNLLEQTSDLTHLGKGRSFTDLGNLGYGGVGGRFNRVGRSPGDPPGPHALTDISGGSSAGASGPEAYAYDANGNMTGIDGLRCTWDFENRLVAVEDATVRAEYTYDYTGRRITRKMTAKQAQTGEDPESADVYVGKHFEVRHPEQAIKYVFNGDVRVASVTGSLQGSSGVRLQRVRLLPGWNLVSLALTATNVLGQLHHGESPPGQLAGSSLVSAAYRWDEAVGGYLALAAGQSLVAGSVLWVKAVTNGVVGIVGAYDEPVARTIPAGGRFVAGPGLEAWRPAWPSTLAVWNHRAGARDWSARLPGLLQADEVPRVLGPGQALYVVTEAPFELTVPDPALRLRFYHQDHLGSASIITDAEGALVQETAFYPSGLARHELRLRSVEEPYQFGQKERDPESGLHYFEARYLAARLARFVTVDPKYVDPGALSSEDLMELLSQPQRINLYQYGLNNPVRYADPSGLDDLDKVGTASDVAGLAGAVVDEVDVWGNVLPKSAGPVLGVVSKTTTVISVAFKGTQFIADPSAATGGQFFNEGAKALTGFAAAPVGMIWAALDLSGYGPSAALEAIEKTTQSNRAATKAFVETAKTASESARRLRQATPIIENRFRVINEKLDQLLADIPGLQATQARVLKRLQDEIRKQERVNRQIRREMRALEKQAREAEE